MSLIVVNRGYVLPGVGGHAPNASVAQITWADRSLASVAPAFWAPHVPLTCSMFAGALVRATASMLSWKQLPGSWGSARFPRSPLVGLPNEPLPLKVLWATSLPHGAYNLNVPNMPLHRLRGVRQTELAPAGSLWSLDVVTDNHVITATPVRSERRAAHGTDVAALRAGFASVTVFDGLTPRTIPVRALCDLVSETIDDSSRRAAMARNAHNAISSVQASLSGAAPR